MSKKQDMMQCSRALWAGKVTCLRFIPTALHCCPLTRTTPGNTFCSHTLSCSGRGKDTSIGQPSPTVLCATLPAAGPEQPLLTLFQNPFTPDFFRKSMCFFLSCKWNKVSMQWFNLSEPATVLSTVSQKMSENIVLTAVSPRAQEH